jgi:hypothetical protein
MTTATKHITDIRSMNFGLLSIEAEPYTAPMKKGFKKCGVRYEGHPLTVQTPRMRLPFHYREDDTSATGAILSSTYATVFEEFLTKLDEQIINSAETNTSSWFGKALTRDTIVGMYKGPYRPPEKYAPSFKMKFNKNEDGTCGFDVFDDATRERRDMTLEQCFERGSEIRAIVECTGVWLVNTNCGYNWRIKQLIVQPPPNKDYAFIDDLDDPVAVSVAPVSVAPVSAAHVPVSAFA